MRIYYLYKNSLWLHKQLLLRVVALYDRLGLGLGLAKHDYESNSEPNPNPNHNPNHNLKFLVDDKGCVLIACWGVPTASHPDNTRRAVCAGAMIGSQLADLGMKTSTGITTGNPNPISIPFLTLTPSLNPNLNLNSNSNPNPYSPQVSQLVILTLSFNPIP
jgi:hypothetical protein